MISVLADRVRAAVHDDFAGDATGHDLAHLDRVARLGAALAEREGADPEIVAVAAYCHDFHRLVERREGHARHVASSACGELVGAALLRAGAPATLAAPVQACVAFCDRHGFAGDEGSGSLEACVLRDADNLDAIGAIGIARAFAFGAVLGEPLWIPDAEAAATYVPGRTSSILHHFEEKLLRLRDDMLTESGRAVAEERHAILERFVAQFRDEWFAGDVAPALAR
ncbi:MAG TPA: HD domain-containing protein [Baekduia sp.]|nr:HD domain-containing protein [Baekduia sp.]